MNNQVLLIGFAVGVLGCLIMLGTLTWFHKVEAPDLFQLKNYRIGIAVVIVGFLIMVGSVIGMVGATIWLSL